MIFSKTGNINAAAIGFIRKAIFSFATISVTPRCKIATRGYAYSAIYILFCISDCVAVSNPYRLIFTKGINQINLKDGRDLIEVYNQYISAHGAAAYTENLYIFFENGYLTCIDYSNPSQSSPLCFQADCNHRSSTCTSWLNTPSRAIYASGDNLYYIDSDKSKTPGLYRMDLSGGRRERVKDLEILENEYWPGISTFGYSFRVYGSYLAVELNLLKNDSRQSMIYLTRIDDRSEGAFVFEGNENGDVLYTAIEFREDWMFVAEKNTAAGTNTLLGYDLSKQSAVPLVEGWDINNSFTMQDNVLYWTVTGEGIYSMDIEEKSIVKYRDLDPVLEYGATAYDDQYLYLTNAIRYMDYQGTVPAEGRGIMVYDFHGNLQQFIPMTQEVGNAMFLLSTPDYVFFYDDSTHSCHPAWYIEKSAIASNSAKMLPVE